MLPSYFSKYWRRNIFKKSIRFEWRQEADGCEPRRPTNKLWKKVKYDRSIFKIYSDVFHQFITKQRVTVGINQIGRME